MKKYIFKAYSKDFPKLFKLEKRKLTKILGKSVVIEHVGSTAVPGLGGKNILDITIASDKNKIRSATKLLIKAKYIFKDKAGSKNRLFFVKDYLYRGRLRQVHIHLTHKNSNVWFNHLKFRDRLINDKKLMLEYATLKKQAVKLGKQGKEYRDYKDKLIKKILK